MTPGSASCSALSALEPDEPSSGNPEAGVIAEPLVRAISSSRLRISWLAWTPRGALLAICSTAATRAAGSRVGAWRMRIEPSKLASSTRSPAVTCEATKSLIERSTRLRAAGVICRLSMKMPRSSRWASGMSAGVLAAAALADAGAWAGDDSVAAATAVTAGAADAGRASAWA